MQKFPIGIQDFEKLRSNGYLYVDKTKDIHFLVESGAYYFLSRPRRFGKSLLISTLKYLFMGRKDLFEDLWIEDNHDWEQTYPVLHISFSSIGYKYMGLAAALEAKVESFASEYGIQLKSSVLDQKFLELLKKLKQKEKEVVLLIDEYDKPLVDYIDQPEQAEINREILKVFFSILKDADAYLKFFLITGVSKFSKVSLFSDLNNLEDITLAYYSGTLTGYTQAELEQYFEEELNHLAAREELDYSALLAKVKLWYNGYLWGGKEKVYNPFSILNLAKQRSFANFWWATGTPTFLIKYLKKEFQYNIETIEVGYDMEESYTLENIALNPLLFQTGYLTIHEYKKIDRLFVLGYPNLEVKDAMHRYLLAAFTERDKGESQALFSHIRQSLEAGKLEQLISLINTLFSTIPHQIFQQKQEAFFHAVLHLSFSGVGLLTESEVSTSQGRVDTVVHTERCIYIMEFKLDESADSALKQIQEKRYGSPFLNQGKEVMAIGINFSSTKKTVEEWKAIAYESLL